MEEKEHAVSFMCSICCIYDIRGHLYEAWKYGGKFKGLYRSDCEPSYHRASLVGYMCYGISFLLYTVIISKFELGYISPILSGVVQIVTLIVAFFVFKEQFSLNAGIGAAMIIAGVIIMNWKF